MTNERNMLEYFSVPYFSTLRLKSGGRELALAYKKLSALRSYIVFGICSVRGWNAIVPSTRPNSLE